MIDLAPGMTRVVLMLAYFAVLTFAGTAGYVVLEGWSWYDALYMAAITITAVGYHEVHALTTVGRNWTMALLAGGLTGLGLWFALLTSLVVRMDLATGLKRRKTMKQLSTLHDHVIVCGGGRMGRQVMHELDAAKKEYVLIERSENRLEDLRETWPNGLFIQADATHDRALEEARIDSASGLLSCLSSDTDNLFVCISARHLRAEMTIVARAEGEEPMAKMYRAGANHVVSPNVTGAIRMASVLVRPSVASFLDVATRGPHLSLRLEQATIGARSALAGKSLAEARIPDQTGLIVIALRKSGAGAADILFNPGGSALLESGDEVIVLGGEDQIQSLREYVA